MTYHLFPKKRRVLLSPVRSFKRWLSDHKLTAINTGGNEPRIPRIPDGPLPLLDPRLWSADVTKDRLDCSVACVIIARLWYVVKRVTLVAGTRQMNYVETVNSIPRLDALSLRAREHDSALFFDSQSESPSSASFSGRNALHFSGRLGRFHRTVAPACDRKLNAHIEHIRSSGGVRSDHKWSLETCTNARWGKTCLSEVSIHSGQLLRPGQNRPDTARTVWPDSLGTVFTFYCFIKTRWQFTA